MTVIISVQGRKGGITKSTTATNVAAGCALMGLRTLLIDADGQGNASSAVGIEPNDGFYALIAQDAEWADVIMTVPEQFAGEGAHLHLVSAADAQHMIEGREETSSLIIQRFQELEDFYDVVIVDTSPGLNYVHNGLYFASDYVLLPTIIEEDSIRSVDKTLSYLANAAAQAEQVGLSAAKVLGILPNRFSARGTVERIWYRRLLELYGDYHIFPVVREYAIWKEARAYRQSIWVASGRWAENARQDMMPVVRTVARLTGMEVVPA